MEVAMEVGSSDRGRGFVELGLRFEGFGCQSRQMGSRRFAGPKGLRDGDEKVARHCLIVGRLEGLWKFGSGSGGWNPRVNGLWMKNRFRLEGSGEKAVVVAACFGRKKIRDGCFVFP